MREGQLASQTEWRIVYGMYTYLCIHIRDENMRITYVRKCIHVGISWCAHVHTCIHTRKHKKHTEMSMQAHAQDRNTQSTHNTNTIRDRHRYHKLRKT